MVHAIVTRLLYTLLLLLVIAATLPLWCYRYFNTTKYRGTLRQRLGHLPRSVQQQIENKSCCWIHAVSVGEVMAARPLIEALHQTRPHWQMVVSTVTRTGQQVVETQIPYACHIFLPFDLPWTINRVVTLVRPRCLILLETELWPNLIQAVAQQGTPVVVVNGRISQRSFRDYHRLRLAMRTLLAPVALLAMQSTANAERLRQLAPPRANITVTGNLKFEQALRLPDQQTMQALWHRLPAATGDLVWVAASTHPGEEELLLSCYRQLCRVFPTLRLILVPRHPERVPALQQWLQQQGAVCQLFSNSHGHWQAPIVLVDEIGWLQRLYGIADVVFVGGSLVPHGGQNPLEPAAWGLVPLFGPHTHNFQEITTQLLTAQAAFQVDDGNALYHQLHTLLADPVQRQQIGQRARQLVEHNLGALERTLAAMREVIPDLYPSPSGEGVGG
ncbi:MAG: 3-deoxy-D-manno-octulosonic acid transferase [Magnetococcales bacterium]|nr:3-deoxy-D-manno-octulosonic acid transferase [Magnetococcales bacterium]